MWDGSGGEDRGKTTGSTGSPEAVGCLQPVGTCYLPLSSKVTAAAVSLMACSDTDLTTAPAAGPRSYWSQGPLRVHRFTTDLVNDDRFNFIVVILFQFYSRMKEVHLGYIGHHRSSIV